MTGEDFVARLDELFARRSAVRARYATASWQDVAALEAQAAALTAEMGRVMVQQDETWCRAAGIPLPTTGWLAEERARLGGGGLS